MTNVARWKVVDENFLQRVGRGEFPPVRQRLARAQLSLSNDTLLDLFDSQVKSRHLDLIARELKERHLSYYTIGSSGHEANAILGQVFPYTDQAFLHYRSGPFYIQRAKQLAGQDPVKNIVLSLVCATADPICSGRHKVFGSVPLNIPPQTSTIASHSPKALGAAMALTRKKPTSAKPATVICSFGDASFNHSTLQGTINAAQWMGAQHYPLPLVLVCEDNGIGVSTATPTSWIEQAMCERHGIHYLQADGLDVLAVYQQAQQALQLARQQQPVFLHLRTKRLLGHAGSDIEQHYWTEQQITANEADDPLLHMARFLVEEGIASNDEIIALYNKTRVEVTQQAESAINLPKLDSARAVMRDIVPRSLPVDGPDDAIDVPSTHPNWAKRADRPLNLAQAINLALAETMANYPKTMLFGEDVAKKGGVYRVTANLQQSFGTSRVFDTLLDEQTILGTAIGFSLQDFIPIPEIQFLAFIHNAVDQIRGEAATLPFFSNGQYANPMLLRVPGLAYQKGFGGHFHNDNAFGFLREIPGVVIACPSRADRAVKLLRSSMQQVVQQRRLVIFLEPIALYFEKGNAAQGEHGWLAAYPEAEETIDFGEVVVTGHEDADIAVLTYGNGAFLSSQAMAKLQQMHDGMDLAAQIKLIDLCWLAPLPEAALAKALQGCKQVIVVDECRETGSLSEQIITRITETMPGTTQVSRIVAKDSFIPLGQSWEYLLPSVEEIAKKLNEALERQGAPEMLKAN